MKATLLAVAALTFFGASTFASGQEAKKDSNGKLVSTAASKGEKPKASPGWYIVEEDWFIPLRLDSLVALDNARMHYRMKEEKKAADELRKAVSWLKLAENHAEPITKEKLNAAAAELTTLADDLSVSKTIDAAKMARTLAKSSQALAEWHYFQAKDHWKLGKSDERLASKHLDAAVAYLKDAARSAHYEFGPDTLTVFREVTKDGVTHSETETYDHNILGKHLDAIESAVKEMSDALMKAGK